MDTGPRFLVTPIRIPVLRERGGVIVLIRLGYHTRNRGKYCATEQEEFCFHGCFGKNAVLLWFVGRKKFDSFELFPKIGDGKQD
jgi:hypothetical protein